MNKRKVCVVVASRANYGRIKTVLKAVKDHDDLELQIVVQASALLYRFGMVVDVIRADGFDIKATVYSILEGENLTTMAKSTGLAISELATIFEQIKPDIVLTVADRFETMATAIAASYMNIPLAHTQGGELTGSIDESVRHAITKLAHIHFPATENASEILQQLGEDPKRIHLTGCPAIDLAAEAARSPKPDLTRYGGVGPPIDFDKPYLVVLQHPVTTEFGQGLAQIEQTLEAIRKLEMQTIWFWPNVDAGSDDVSKGLRVFGNRYPDLPIHFYRNFTPEDFVHLINDAACMVGNSSSAIREGSFLGVPAVNVGTRQQQRERGSNVIDVGYDAREITEAVKRQLKTKRYRGNMLYGSGTAGTQIAQILATTSLGVEKKFYKTDATNS